MDYQPLIIEDSQAGACYVTARIVAEWDGFYGYHRFLETPDGTAYWWLVVPDQEGRGPEQRLIAFASWEDLEAELGEMVALGRGAKETGVTWH